MNYLTESKHNTIQVTEVYSPPYCEGLPAQEKEGSRWRLCVVAVLSEQSCGCGGHIVSVSHCAWPLRSAPQPPHCAVVPPLVTTHITLIHGAEMLRRPTVSTPATVTYIVRIAQLLPLRMKELLNSKPPALHLERPLGPMLPCPAAWPEQSSGRTQHWPPQHTTLPQLFALNGSAFAYIWCKYQQHGYKEGKQHVE